MKMYVDFIFLLLFLVAHGGSKVAVNENNDEMTWEESMNACADSNQTLLSSYPLNISSLSYNPNRSNHEQYWVNGRLTYLFVQYVGCIDSNFTYGDERDISNSLEKCAEKCNHTSYSFFAISDLKCECLSNESAINTSQSENCTVPCTWNQEAPCGIPNFYAVYSLSAMITLVGDRQPLQSCIYQLNGTYHIDNCSATHGYICGNDLNKAFNENLTWIQAQRRCNEGQGNGTGQGIEPDIKYWTSHYRLRTVLRNASSHLSVDQYTRCLSMSANYTNPVFRNCSDKLKSLCEGVISKFRVSDTNHSWDSAVEFCQKDQSMLLNTKSFNTKQLLSSLDDKGHLFWTGGYLSSGNMSSSVFGKYGCINRISVSNYTGFKIKRKFVSLSECEKRCTGNKFVALMDGFCRCMDDANFTYCNATNIKLCCNGSADRCGTNDSYSVYKRYALEDLGYTGTGNCVYGIKHGSEVSTFGLANCNETNHVVCNKDKPPPSNNLTASWSKANNQCIRHHGEELIDTSDLDERFVDGITYWIGRYIPDTLKFVTISDRSVSPSPRKCLAIEVKNGKLKERLVNCSKELKVICQTVEVTKDEKTTVDARTAPLESSTTVSREENKTANPVEDMFTTAAPIAIPYAMYGLIGGIIVVVLILSFVCVVLCMLMIRYRELKGQLSSKSLKGPTISYSNLEYSDFTCSGKATHGDSVDSDPLKGDESTDRVADVVIQDDNSDVKSIDMAYSECRIIGEDCDTKQENKVCLNTVKPDQPTGTDGNENIYSLAKKENENYIYQNETDMGISKSDIDQDDIYMNSDSPDTVDDKEIYLNNIDTFPESSTKADESDYDYNTLFELRNVKENAPLYDTSASIENERRSAESSFSKPNCINNQISIINPEDVESGKEYDRVNVVNNTYDELETQANRSRSKPIVLHYEDIELPQPLP